MASWTRAARLARFERYWQPALSAYAFWWSPGWIAQQRQANTLLLLLLLQQHQQHQRQPRKAIVPSTSTTTYAEDSLAEATAAAAAVAVAGLGPDGETKAENPTGSMWTRCRLRLTRHFWNRRNT